MFNKEAFSNLQESHQQFIMNEYTRYKNGEINDEELFNNIYNVLGEITKKLYNMSDKDIKTEKLTDIIEYSGVDLKKEAEHINKEQSYYSSSHAMHTDVNNKLDSLVSPELFAIFFQKLCNKHNIGMKSECLAAFFLALRRQIKELIEDAYLISKLRTDAALIKYEKYLKISTEIRKELYILEEKEKELMKKINSEEYIERVERTAFREREDLLIRKQMRNDLALQALGKKDGSEFLNDFDELSDDDIKNNNMLNPSVMLTMEDIKNNILNRKISKEDILNALENTQYKKDIFLIKQYLK